MTSEEKDISGILNIYKEKNYTSHDVVAIIRKLCATKTGHTGTLDPMAEGVLPICLGKATKLSERFSSDDKSYRAELILGIETDTEDVTGKVLEKRPVVFDREQISKAIYAFSGHSMQTPPMYSAIKQNGKKLYELARKGITVEREPRPIFVSDIYIHGFDEEKQIVIFELTCTKGTYIRTICADIGRALGCGACMGELLRTRSGRFELKDSHKLADVKLCAAENRIEDILIPVSEFI